MRMVWCGDQQSVAHNRARTRSVVTDNFFMMFFCVLLPFDHGGVLPRAFAYMYA